MPKRKSRTASEAVTVAFPQALPVRRETAEVWWVTLPERELRLSNLTKIFWPEEGYTKGDLLAYYFNVAHLLLPHLERRPLTMKRMPNGMDGDSFYEKTAPSHTPDWVHRCTVLSEDAKEGRIDYLTIDDLSTLLFVANLGAIEMHPLHSRCSDTEHPDYLFFDLDPFPPYTYEDVLTVARHVKVVLDQLGLTGYPKTSGATGLQIYVPIEAGRWTYGEVRAFVGACGRMIGRADPDRVTMAWRIADRTGKIFIDHNMNRQGANIAAAYSLRPELRAPVSTPLTWDEVEAGGFEPQDFRIDNVWERFAEVGDRWAPVREGPYNDLAPAMEALGVEPEEDPSGPLPRTASSAVAAKSSDEIALASKDPALFEYVRRREFGAEGTTEPAPGEDVGTGTSFVIHKHRATRLHYDVRLERDGGPALVGGPEGPPDHQGRQTPGGPHRGPPARIREVRGHDPRRPLRRRRGAHLRRRLVRTGRVDRHEGLVPAPRAAVPEPRVPLRQDTDGLARVPRERADRPADRLAAVVPPDARRGRPPGLRRRRLVVRAEARRDPMSRRALDGRDGAALAHRTRRHRARTPSST